MVPVYFRWAYGGKATIMGELLASLGAGTAARLNYSELTCLSRV